MRSKLFVPGSRPELFPKAFRSAADALSFDLEDAVAEARKAEARALLGQFLREMAPQPAPAKTVIVRVNAMDTPHFEADIAAVVQTGVHLVNLPKPASPAAVQQAAQCIAAAAQANGVAQVPGLLLNIETPQALRTAADLAQAHPSVQGLQLGLGDLFEPSGISRRCHEAIAQAMFAVRMAAAEAGIYAYDGAFADIQNAAGFQAEAEFSKSLGFLGKTCIHPSQIAMANAVYQPSAAELAAAQEVLEAARAAEAQGVGAYVVQGKMVDKPFVLRAQRTVDAGRAAGLC